MSKPIFEDIFTFSGRRNRKSYLFYTLAVTAITLVAAFVIGFLSAATGGLGIILAVLLLPVIVSSWAVGSQRCRDFGWTGWAILLTMIPYLGLVFVVILLVVPGTVGENRYGPDPLGNSTPPTPQRA